MSFKSQLIVGIGAGLAVLLAIGLLSLRSMSRSTADARWVTHTHVVLETLETVQAAVIDAETSQRAYLLSGDAAYLDESNASLVRTRRLLRDIRSLTADNPVQQHALDKIEPAIQERVAVLQNAIAIGQSRGFDAGQAALSEGSGERTLDGVRAAISGMEDEEHSLLDTRTKEAEASTVQAERVVLFGNAVALCLLVFAATVIYREMARRRTAEDAVNELNATLEARIEERTAELALSNAELSGRTADLARSNAELQQFAYVASHDLQEPLRMVASFTQLLAKRYNDKLGDDAREFIQYAVDGATRLQTLITDLLSYSRVGTHAKTLKLTNADAALDRVLAGLQLAIHDSGATIVRDPLPTVMADEVQFCQLLQNLLTNAMKFKGSHPPLINVFSQRQDGFWRISVRDNGIGIDPDHYDRIWVIFQRLHTKTEYPGTGIGLAICKKIAERHGGTIGVEPSPGGGSTFFFTIPVLEKQSLPEENNADELRTAVAVD